MRWKGMVSLLLLVLLVLSLLGGLYSLARVSRATARVRQADQVRLSLAALMTKLESAESGQRGYLATSDWRLLRPYERARVTWRDDVARLRRFTASDPHTSASLDGIERLIDRKFEHMATTLQARDSGVTSIELANTVLVGEARMEDVRAAVFALEDGETKLSDAREVIEESRARLTKLVFSGGVLALALALATFALQRRDERAKQQRAEERAALLDLADQFIGVLGHDLRNPLGATLMAARLLAERATTESDRTLALRIENSGERMLRMIEEILDLARSRVGTGIPVVRTKGDLRDIIANAVDELRTAHPARRIDWSWIGDGDGQWDHDRMSQAVSNLVANAIEHGDPKGPVELHLRGTNGRIDLDVHNIGAPNPPAQMRTLFASYRQPSRATTSTGLGLGLYIADQIVRAHDGSITVRSSADTGTTFTVTFARAR